MGSADIDLYDEHIDNGVGSCAVMAIAALWLPLERHLVMDIAMDRLR